MKEIIVLFITLLSSGCAFGDINEKVVGIWRSQQGEYTINIKKDHHYEFCDIENCFFGNWISPNGKDEFSADLKNFSENEIGKNFGIKYNVKFRDSDMEFRLSYTGQNYPYLKSKCSNLPCAVYGEYTTDKNAVFSRITVPGARAPD